MKKNKIMMLLVCSIFMLGAASSLSAQDKKKGKEKVKFLVEQMSCKNCQAKIEKNIAFEKGVTDLKCDLETQTVEVTYKADKTTPEAIAKGFEKIGYTVKVVKDEPAEKDKKK